jgi:hypothetical protein
LPRRTASRRATTTKESYVGGGDSSRLTS